MRDRKLQRRHRYYKEGGCEDSILVEGGTCQEAAVLELMREDGDFAIEFYFTDGEEQDWLLHSIRGRVLIWHVAIRAQNQSPHARIR